MFNSSRANEVSFERDKCLSLLVEDFDLKANLALDTSLDILVIFSLTHDISTTQTNAIINYGLLLISANIYRMYII